MPNLSLVGLVSQPHSFHEDCFFFNEERDSVFSDPEAMSGGQKIDEWFSADQGVFQSGIAVEFFNNTLLNFLRESPKISVPAWSEPNKIHSDYRRPKSEQILEKGIHPLRSASRTALFMLRTNLGLTGRAASILSMSQPAGFILDEWYSSSESLSRRGSSIAERTSKRAKVSNANTLGMPLRSTYTAALESLASLMFEKRLTLPQVSSFWTLQFLGVFPRTVNSFFDINSYLSITEQGLRVNGKNCRLFACRSIAAYNVVVIGSLLFRFVTFLQHYVTQPRGGTFFGL